jgi:uncharacterized protein
MSRPPAITHLAAVLTGKCNLRCVYCYQTPSSSQAMGWDILRTSLDLAAQSRSPEVTVSFIGGEPLLETDLLRKAVAYAEAIAPSGKRFKFSVSTNGLLWSDEVEEFFERHKFKIQLSFDGIAAAQDYRLQGSFSLLDDLLERLIRKRPLLLENQVQIAVTLLPATIPFFADSIGYLMDRKVSGINVGPSFTTCGEWKEADFQALRNQFARIYDVSLQRLKETGDVPFSLFRKDRPRAGGEKTEACNAARGAFLAVDAAGQAYSCVLFVQSYQRPQSDFLEGQLAPLRLGDVRDPDFLERLSRYPALANQTDIFRNQESRFSNYGKCSECRHQRSCYVCPASIGFDRSNSDPCRVPDFVCAFNLIASEFREKFPGQPDAFERLNMFLESNLNRRLEQ